MPWGNFEDLLDTGALRYGVSTAEKERLAREGSLPGAPVDHSADQTKADRYAAGFLFGQNWPRLSEAVQPVVDRIKTSDLPFFGGSTPEEQSYASAGAAQGRNSNQLPLWMIRRR